jgi:uncharacterized membrane protein (DUF373 family)
LHSVLLGDFRISCFLREIIVDMLFTPTPLYTICIFLILLAVVFAYF